MRDNLAKFLHGMYDLRLAIDLPRLRTSGTSFSCEGDLPTALPTYVRIFKPEDASPSVRRCGLDRCRVRWLQAADG